MPGLRVLVVTHAAELGGAELALLRLLEHLDPAAAHVRVVTWAEGSLADRLRGLGRPVTVLDAGGLGTVTRRDAARWRGVAGVPGALRLAMRLRRVIRSERADLVVAHSLKSAFVVALAAPLARRRWVWHLHDRLARDYLPGLAVLATRALASWGPRAVLANSQATRASLPPRAQRRATVAHPGVDPGLGAHGRTPPAVPTVGIVGRVSETKGQLEFVAAARTVARTRPDVRFVIIGAALFSDAPYEHEVRAAARGLVAMPGWADDPVAAMTGLTVVVHASPIPEPFGQVVAEAIALGIPVVATDAGGVPEIVDPEGSARSAGGGVRDAGIGLLVPPCDVPALAAGIAAVLSDPSRWSLQDHDRAAAVARLSAAATADAATALWRRSAR